MPSDDATVADVLAETGDSETIPLLEVATGILENPEALDYEDWVRPMKLTGGRVCLAFDWQQHGGVSYARWTPKEMQYHNGDRVTLTGPSAVQAVRDFSTADVPVTEPVLREDTPFAEVDDDG